MHRLLLLAVCMTIGCRATAAEEPQKASDLMPPGYMTEPSLNPDVERLDPLQKQLLERQHKALVAIPDVRVRYSPNGTPYHVEGNTGMHFNRIDTWKPGDRAPEVLEELRDLLTARGTEELRVRTVQDARKQNPSTRFSKSIVRFDQYIRGIPVRYAAVILNLDPETAELQYLSSTFLPDRGLPQKASITSSEAKQLASKEVGSMTDAPGAPTTPSYPEPELMYVFEAFVDGRPAGRGDLAWIIHLTREVGGFPEELRVVISAKTGRALEVRPALQHSMNRQVFSANHSYSTNSLSFTALFTEGDVGPDATSQNAYDNAGITYQASHSCVGAGPGNRDNAFPLPRSESSVSRFPGPAPSIGCARDLWERSARLVGLSAGSTPRT